MSLSSSESLHLSDDESSEAEADTYAEPKYTHTPETEVEINTSVVPITEAEAELLLEPEPINCPISAHESESVYEYPYSTNIYHNYGGTRISFQNFGNESIANDQSRSKKCAKKWSLSCLIIGLVIGFFIGATVTGLSIFFITSEKTACAPVRAY